MTETGSARTGATIMVAVDAMRRSRETLEMAAALATSVGSDLDVVFVEDEELLRLADLPVTREVDRLSGTSRELSSGRMLRALHCEARQLRNELLRIARATSVRSTVRVVRGRVLREALAAPESIDVTFVHGTRRMLSARGVPDTAWRRPVPASLRGRGQRVRRRTPVWTLFEGGSASVRTLEVAARVAQSIGCSLQVLVPWRDEVEAAHHKREARTIVGEIEVGFFDVPANRPLLQKRILAPGTGSLLVLAKRSHELDDEVTRSYLETLAIPLVLVA